MTTPSHVTRSVIISRIADRLEPAVLAGSLLAAPPDRRVDYARDLFEAGAWLHVDLIDAAYPIGCGVSVEMLGELSAWSQRLDVHLLVSDPVAAVDCLLAGPVPARITVQVENLPDLCPDRIADLAARCRRAGASLWLGVAPRTDPLRISSALDQADGVLIMLTEPGRSGVTVQPEMIHRLAGLRQWPLAVDGGVTDKTFPDLLRADVGLVVIGRWLWAATEACTPITPQRRGAPGGGFPVITGDQP